MTGPMPPSDAPTLAEVLRPSPAAWARAAILAIAFAALLGLAALHGGPAAAGWSAYVVAAVLVWLSAIDIEHGLLPDVITLPLIAAGLLRSALGAGPDLVAAALGAALGYLLVRALDSAWQRVRGRAGIGQGDAKLLAAAGAWCGAQALAMVLMVASTSALALIALVAVLTRRPIQSSEAVPFGPFLALGMISALLYFDWAFPELAALAFI